MELKINNNIIRVFLDTKGNIYFNYNNNIYDIDINNNNTISLCLCSSQYINIPDLIIVDAKFENLVLTENAKSLKGKIKKNMIKENIDNNDHDVIIDDCDDGDISYKYYYENLEFCETDENINADNDNDFYDETEIVKFLRSTDTFTIIVCDNENSDTALYDIMIYDDDNLLFKTEIINIVNGYRLKLYKSGLLSFRSIGDDEKLYRITIDGDTMSLMQSD